jgi:DNA-binding CsgD family transcriptional regulator
MSAISHRDYEAVLAAVGRLYECERLTEFPRLALTETLVLVGADSGIFNYVAPSVPVVNAVSWPHIETLDQGSRIMAKHLPEHPVLKHFLVTGDKGAYKISDFLSVREYHALDLYQNLFRAAAFEDQFTIKLFAPGAEMVAISLARDRCSFTERDRQVLNLLRPYVAKAYRHVERNGLLHRSLARRPDTASELRSTSVQLNTEDRPINYGPEARQWIRHFFPEHPRRSSRLPDAVNAWLRRVLTGRRDALVQERDGQRLRLSLYPGWSEAARILVLGLETLPTTAQGATMHGLSGREIEVLLQVEQGRTNDETAAALGISPFTVRHHLEHVFEKLHVPSRTAAVTQFRRLCSPESLHR